MHVKKTLIFSDVHLKVSPHDRERHQEFIHFLKGFSPEEYDRVIRLGDLFDFWFEYRHVIFSGYFDVLRAFADMRDAGMELHLICGNHDFWGGRFLHDDLGFHIHPNSVALSLGERKAHFIHGDGLNPTDKSYRAYKKFARNPFVVGAFRFIHPDWAMKIAQGVSHGSRTYLGQDDPTEGPEAKALKTYGERKLDEGTVDAVLCGHAHAPLYHPHGDGVYINTGDWLQHRSYVTWDEAGFHLHGANAS